MKPPAYFRVFLSVLLFLAILLHWNQRRNGLDLSIPGVSHVFCLLYSPDGRFLISLGNGDGTIRVWNALSGRLISIEKSAEGPVSAVLSPDGKTLIVGHGNLDITRRSLNSFGELGSPAFVASGAGDHLALSPDGKWLAAYPFERVPPRAELEMKPNQMGYDRSYSIAIFDYVQGKRETRLAGIDRIFRDMVFSTDSKLLFGVGDGMNGYRAWDTDSWKGTFHEISKVGSNDVFGVAVSRDGKFLATAHQDSSVVILEPESKKEILNSFVPRATTWAVAFSPDGKHLASANLNDVYLWDTTLQKPRMKLPGHKDYVFCLAFSPDGRQLATAGNGENILIWDLSARGCSSVHCSAGKK